MKNRLFLLALSILPFINLKGQEPITVFYNYIKSTEYLTENGESGSKIGNIVYSNNFGATTQVINVSGTPDQKDIAVKQIYGDYGRPVKKLLPVPTTQAGGDIIDEEDFSDYYINYYQTNYNEPQYFYSEVELEAPPLNRVLKKSSPGTDWSMGAGNEVEYKYEVVNPSVDIVVNYKANTAWNATNKIYTISLQKVGNYGAGLLHKTTQTDENGHKTEQFVNRKGQTVLIRKFSTTGTGNAVVKHDTYYVYDSYGNLTYMLPPKLSDITTITAANITEMGYQYKYDKRNRLVEKQLPGKGLETFVYDKQDRLVATKDAVNPWMFIKYDKFGRELYSGTYSGSETRVALQNTVDGFGANNEERATTAFSQDGLNVYYTKSAFPTGSFSLLNVNYYDNYTNIMAAGVSIPSSVEGQNTIIQANDLNGVPIASFTRILGASKWEQAYTFYDNKLQPLRTYKLNHLGGYTYIDSKLDFRGKPEYTKTYHKRLSSNQEIMFEDSYTYDHQERLLNSTNKIGAGNSERISSNTYDALGSLVSKGIGNTTALAALQKVDYKYNIRGWMTDINNTQTLSQSGYPIDLFAFKIYYNTSDDIVSADLGIEGLHNGNISQTLWRTASDNVLRGYAYEYDQLNRLRNAHYYKPGATVPFPENFNESLTYDLNGNISSLLRKSSLNDVPTASQLTDNLIYSYATNSNKLLKITDETNSETGFSNGTSGTSNDYTYDLNGNMLTDRNKDITTNPITYNFFNQPTSVIWTSTKKIEFQYNAAGQKVQKTVTNGSSVIITDYLDGFQYNQQMLEFFPTSEGYVKVTAGSINPNNPQYAFNYVYNHTDHLGNIRLSYSKDPQTGNLKILDESHYYPFGLKHNKYSAAGFIWSPAGVIIAPIANNPFKYKFQSQELQEDHNLNWYSYRYRNYDPAIGRFFNVDPLSESFAYNGVYNFSENRVIDAFELEGLESVQVNGEEYADFDRNGEMDIVALDGATIFSGVSQPIKNASASIDWGPLVSKGIEFSNGWQQGKQDFVSDTYQNLSHNLYTREYWEGKAGDAYNLAQLNSDPLMKAQMGMSIYNASAYDWGHFAGYEGTSFAVSYAATAGLGEIGSLGSAFGKIKIPKFGVNKPTLRLAYETEVKELSSIVNNMRAGGDSSEKIARILHGLRRDLGIKYKSLTPDDVLQKIYQRNIQKYGDKLGPSIEYLRQQGKSWDDIIEGAIRPGGKDMKF